MASLHLTGEEALGDAAPLQSVHYLESPTRHHLFLLWRRGRQRGSHLGGVVVTLSLFAALAAAYFVLRCGLQLKARKGSGGLRSLADAGEEEEGALWSCEEEEDWGSGAAAAEAADGNSTEAAASAGEEGGNLEASDAEADGCDPGAAAAEAEGSDPGAVAAEAEGSDPGAAAGAAAAAGAEGSNPEPDPDEVELDDERKEVVLRASAYIEKLVGFAKRAVPVFQQVPLEALREGLGGVLILCVVEMTCMATLLKGEEREGIQTAAEDILNAAIESTKRLSRKTLPATTFRHFRFLKELLTRIPKKEPANIPLRQRLERLREILTVQEMAVEQMLHGIHAMEELCENKEWLRSPFGAPKFAKIFKKTASLRRNHVLRERTFGIWLVLQHKMFCHYGLTAYPHLQSLVNQVPKSQKEQLGEIRGSPLAMQLLMPGYGYKGGVPKPREEKSKRRKRTQTKAPAPSAQKQCPEAAPRRGSTPVKDHYVVPPRFKKPSEESKIAEVPQETQLSSPPDDAGSSDSSSPKHPSGAESPMSSEDAKLSDSQQSPPSESERRCKEPDPSESPGKAAAPAPPSPQEEPKAADREASSSPAAPSSAAESTGHPGTSSQPGWPGAARAPRSEELPRGEEAQDLSARFETRSSPEAPQRRPPPGFPPLPAYPPPQVGKAVGELGKPPHTPGQYGFPTERSSSGDLAELGASSLPFLSDARVAQQQPEAFPPAALRTDFAGPGAPPQQYGFPGAPGAPVRSRAPEGPPISLSDLPRSSHGFPGPVEGQYSERPQFPGPPASPRKMPPGRLAGPAAYFPPSQASAPRAAARFAFPAAAAAAAAADSPWQFPPSDLSGVFSPPPPFIPPESFFPGGRSPEPTQHFPSEGTFFPSAFSFSPPPDFGRDAGRLSFPAGHRGEAWWPEELSSQPYLELQQPILTQYPQEISDEELLLHLGGGSSLLDWPAGSLAALGGAPLQTRWSTQDDATPPAYQGFPFSFPEESGWWPTRAPQRPPPDFEKAPGASWGGPARRRSTFKGMATGEPKPRSSHGAEQ
ncbi:hypothetical protein, conserved [Eimeria necatrix]|uniref:Uncharacterized protein n=1 Tax=Eimeria necatrix TaxID=51315 RepID=U6MWX7_9EIME|nr:hypothetical protein, conserved [Eimeria necatrix]CDJ66999.1 hypothetical protein, conserved [Eimeria necatrix]